MEKTWSLFRSVLSGWTFIFIINVRHVFLPLPPALAPVFFIHPLKCHLLPFLFFFYATFWPTPLHHSPLCEVFSTVLEKAMSLSGSFHNIIHQIKDTRHRIFYLSVSICIYLLPSLIHPFAVYRNSLTTYSFLHLVNCPSPFQFQSPSLTRASFPLKIPLLSYSIHQTLKFSFFLQAVIILFYLLAFLLILQRVCCFMFT